MQIVPTAPLPNQQLQVSLSNQFCQINIRQQFYGLFLDLYVAGTLIIAGQICQNLNPIVRSVYLGFGGDLLFYDNTGQGNDPVYTGLGTTYSLVYLSVADIAQSISLVTTPSAGLIDQALRPTNTAGGGVSGPGFYQAPMFNSQGVPIGAPSWNAAVVSQYNGYAEGMILRGNPGSVGGSLRFWTCLVNNNNTNPDMGGAGWQLLLYPSNKGR